MSITRQFEGVSVETKANIYFEGKVVSHTILFPNGEKKTLGLIFPGKFTFNTGAPEQMDFVAGTSYVRVAGAKEWTAIAAGEGFHVPANSFFDIEVREGVAEYICSFGK